MPEIKFYELQCPRCGGGLNKQGEESYVCSCCGKTFEKQVVTDIADRLRAVLDEQKQEAIANLRRQLWEGMHAQYINSARIVELARDIKKYLPEDYFANFCETANTANDRVVNGFLNSTSKENMADYADIVLDFMLKSAKSANLTAISLFIERAYKGDTANYDKYTTKLEEEAEKVNKGVYDLIVTRDVFLAYSSADIEKVLDLCDYLESNKISCFLALRNLRHGRGAVDNYDAAIKTAIDNCKTVIFVSSKNSRSMTCDALTKELPYIRQKDIGNAPAEYRYNYERLPAEYMMPRVEYIIDDYVGGVGDDLTKEFFHGLEWCKSKEAVALRISRYITGVHSQMDEHAAAHAAEESAAEDKNARYCKKCRTANKPTARFCSKCGGHDFFASYKEYLESKIKFCSHCGAQNNYTSRFCAECGSHDFVSTRAEYEALVKRREEDERRRQANEEQTRRTREEHRAERQRRSDKRKAAMQSGAYKNAVTEKIEGFLNAVANLPILVKLLLCLPFVNVFYGVCRIVKGVMKKDILRVLLAVITIWPGTLVMLYIDILWVIWKGHAFLLGDKKFS